MKSKFGLIVLIVLIGVLSVIGFVGFGVWRTTSNTPAFIDAGYILQGGVTNVKQIPFASGSTYTGTLSGDIKLTDADGTSHIVSKESFVHMETEGMMALSDGILLDFNDLTDNFINNYYIRAGLAIAKSGDTYTAQTSSGVMQFGEHLWKLSDSKYIIVSPTVNVSLGGSSEPREVNDYVQISVSEDGIVYILTPENIWMTISESCVLETAGGVKIYPMKKMVDDGTYKLSLAKLSVSADDAIVLTEDETRRQIVPELNITGVDGADGKDGPTGEAGTEGATGEDGSDGEKGSSGSSGSTGSSGSAGASGNSGLRGEDGIIGTPGDPGNTGGTGFGGATGGMGAPGADALIDSSTNTAIPTMTITDWRVTANSLSGKIVASDVSQMLEKMQDVIDSADSDKYLGRVTITNVLTGEVVYCYQAEYDKLTDSYTLPVGLDADAVGFDEFYRSSQASFSTLNDPLQPDTEYKFSVTAYYRATDETGLFYSREFISRHFYTDSTGVSINHISSTENTIGLTATLDPAYEGSVQKAIVFLLTPEQNKTFSAASVMGSTNDYYSAKYEIGAADFAAQGGTVSFDMNGTSSAPLEHNKTYIARVYVETSVLKILTKQSMEVMTLKLAPSVRTDVNGDKEVPIAAYNRLTGAFEIYRPGVNDPDGGAVQYAYTAYCYDDQKNEWVEESTRIKDANSATLAEFYLSAGKTYQFGIKMKFFDNKKYVYYDLGRSGSVFADGDAMPKLTLIPGDSGEDYNKFNGTLRINLGPNSALVTNEPTRPLRVELFADSLATTGRAVELYEGQSPQNVAGGADDRLGTMFLSSVSGTTIDVSLDLQNLYKDTNYSIVVSGYLDVGDANDVTYRVVGTVAFKTYDTMTLNAAFTTPSSTEAAGKSLSLKLRLSVARDTTGAPNYDLRKAYAENQLTGGTSADDTSCGQVTVALYQGYGISMRPIAQMNFNEKEQLDKLFGDGLVITEAHFGNLNIDGGSTYTMAVTSVSDSSFRYPDLGYVNTYDDIKNPTGTTAGLNQPPDLMANPTTGVVVAPIYNEDAALYGAVESEILPEDAIIGFTLSSTYSNVQRIGTSVTYYAYEYSAFLNAIGEFNPNAALKEGETPCTTMKPLMTMTQPVLNTSDTVPKVAILFGGTKTEKDEDAKLWNGHSVYYAGPVNFSSSLADGMGRGFRYVFAYEVKYATSSLSSGGATETITNTYPYDHPDYSEYQTLYGGLVSDKGRRYGRAYVLTSSMVEAPRILPDFHFYVANSTGTASSTLSSGTITLHYSWRDVEYYANPTDPASKMVITTENDSNRTALTFRDFNGASDTRSEFIGLEGSKVDGAPNWYKVTIPYSFTKGSTVVLTPTLNIGAYRVDYKDFVREEKAENDMKLGPIIPDWAWGDTINATYTNSQNAAFLEQKMNQAENYISFYIMGPESAVEDIAGRAIAMELTFAVKGTDIKKTLMLPVIYDATGQPGVRVMTANLGSDFLSTADNKKEYVVSDAKLYYDNGLQGWEYAVNTSGNPYFTVQYVGEKALGDYQGASPSVSAGTVINASGALSRVSEGEDILAKLRATINIPATPQAYDKELDIKATFNKRPVLTGFTSGLQYLYPTQQGVDTGSSTDTEQLTGKYIVPKGVSVYNLTFKHEGSTQSPTTEGELTDLTPTANYTRFLATTNAIYTEGLKVDGFVGKDTIYLAAYLNEPSALALDGSYVKEPKAVYVEAIDVAGSSEKRYVFYDEHGEQISESVATTISGLQNNTTYFVAVYYKNSMDQKVHLIDQKKAKKFVHEVTTSEKTVISIKKSEYENNSYMEKELQIRFNMSPAHDQTLRYDIYSTNAGASGDTPAADKLVLSYEDMKDVLIVEPGVIDAVDNDLVLKLEPRGERAKLKPGVTYYLRITSSSGGEQTGYTVHPFTLDVTGNYGALVYLKHASSEEVTFSVTITDPQFSLMAYDPVSNSRILGGRYAVRFTDEAGNRIYTKYDDQIFDALSLQQEFALNNTTRTGGAVIKPNTPYQIHVFAAPDPDHKGSITLNGTTYSYKDMFSVIGEGDFVAVQFHALIDSLWDTNGVALKDDAKNEIRTHLCIAEKTHSTTSTSNWMFNENNIAYKRQSALVLRVVFAESIGLVTDDAPVFRQVDWYVEGTADDGTAIIANGVAKYTASDALLKKGEMAGQEIFYYDIPYDLPQGAYTVIIQLRTAEGIPAPTYTVTLRTAG